MGTLSSTPGPATCGFHLKHAQSGNWLSEPITVMTAPSPVPTSQMVPSLKYTMGLAACLDSYPLTPAAWPESALWTRPLLNPPTNLVLLLWLESLMVFSEWDSHRLQF